MMILSRPRLEISIGTQTLSLWDGRRLVKSWPCSTSRYGVGFTEGSLRTPLGQFRVAEKHGENAAANTIFKSRRPVGAWQPGDPAEDDLVLARILWLEGLEPRNANTRQRYIYIHGTNHEETIGRPDSHGCIRLRNADVIELYALAAVGWEVWIAE